MAKARAVFRCSACGVGAPRWAGRCSGCSEWNTLTEEIEERSSGGPVGPPLTERAQPINEVDLTLSGTRPTGISELDRVLGGGLVPGSVTLLGGEPGIGKSTLLLQVAARWADMGSRVLYVSAEESRQQVRLRADRLGAVHPRLWLVSELAVPHIVQHIDEVQPDLLIVDSIQSVHDPELGGAPGSVSQVRDCAHRLVSEAKARGLATILVGHVTKDGSLAGPRVLEHVVDTVLAFEGDRHHALRLLRAVKHRYGATHDLGVFEMGSAGLAPVADPSSLFLSDRCKGVAGSVVLPTMEGHRPLLVELQALVVSSTLSSPRRSAEGVDSGRLALLLAVLERRAGLVLAAADVYALVVGGVKVTEPGADLAVALAVASALTGRPIPDDVVACGEIGLGGEIRQAAQTERRLAEAARLGFGRAMVAASAPAAPAGIVAVRVATLSEAIAVIGVNVR